MSQQLLESLDAIRVRSDIERKRLHGLAPSERSGSGIDSGIYSADASQHTYARLAGLATMILRAGHTVIVDAAFLRHVQRDQLRAVADQEHALFVILDIQTPESACINAGSKKMRLLKQDWRYSNTSWPLGNRYRTMNRATP